HHDHELQPRPTGPQGPPRASGDRAGARSRRIPAPDPLRRGQGGHGADLERDRLGHARGLAMPAFDRVEAQRLVDTAGWKKERQGTRVARGVTGVIDGTRLAIDFVHFPTFAKYGELMRQYLGAVGIELIQRPLEPAVFAPTVFKDRAFDTNVISY